PRIRSAAASRGWPAAIPGKPCNPAPDRIVRARLRTARLPAPRARIRPTLRVHRAAGTPCPSGRTQKISSSGKPFEKQPELPRNELHMRGQAMIVRQQQHRNPARIGERRSRGHRAQLVVEAVYQHRLDICPHVEALRPARDHGWQRDQKYPGARHLQRSQPRDERAHAGAGQHQRLGRRARVGDQFFHPRLHGSGMAQLVVLSIIRALREPAEFLGDLRQRADLGRVGAAVGTVGEDGRAGHLCDPGRRSLSYQAPSVEFRIEKSCDTQRMPELAMHDWPLPYAQRLRERALAEIDLVVIHCTELPDLATAREYGERVQHADGSGNSGHWYVDRDGALHRFVAETRIANHTRGYNERSLGVELVNSGRYPDWFDSRKQVMSEPYPDLQIASLLALLRALRGQCPNLRWLAGHEDLDAGMV